MITKSDWQDVHQTLMAEGRRTLGEPPTADEMLAYTHGELSPAEEERIRELLVVYPDLVRTLTEPFPAKGAEPGDPDFMSEHEFARHWKSLQTKMDRPKEVSGLQFWRVSAVLAAALVLVFSGLLWKARSDLAQPRAGWEEQVLWPEGGRGGGEGAVTLVGSGPYYMLVITVTGDPRYARYRVELVDEAGERLWSGLLPARGDDGTLSLMVPRTFLKPGRHRIMLYGIDGAREQQLETYALKVPKP
jgi:hypothetical protein